ncbi:hypothetical protein MBLNU457_g0299t1 [Dothideomycetes sp. NU457]
MDPPPPRRSNSRSRRSHPTFSDLRLAPLKTTDDSVVHPSPVPPKTPTDPSIEFVYKANHSSYLTGRSLPSTPGGILTRSSSRKQLHGGLSRRSSIYDTTFDYAYNAATTPSDRAPLSQKSASEAVLAGSEQEKRQATQLRGPGKPLPPRSGTRSGAQTPRSRSHAPRPDDDWLSHTVTFTSNLLAESKGHSYLHSSSTHLPSLLVSRPGSPSSSEEDEDAYRTPREHISRSYATTPARSRSPVLTRENTGWGSRFGSRAGSGVPSRRESQGALSSAVTPFSVLPPSNKNYFAREFQERGYFDSKPVHPRRSQGSDTQDRGDSVRPDFVDQKDVLAYSRTDTWDDEDDERDEEEIARLASTPSYGLGLGSVVDQLVGFSFLNDPVEDAGEGRDEESDRGTREEVRKSRERLLQQQARRKSTTARKIPEADEEQGQMWSDAKWLLEVAGRVLLS